MNANANWVLVVMGLGMMLFGGIFFAFIVRDYLAYLDSGSWQPLNAQVVSSDVVRMSSRESYRIRIQYRYRIGRQIYEGNRYHFTGSVYTNRYDEKAAIAEQYPPLTPITIYYDPDNPKQTVIKREMSEGMVWFLRFGGVGLGGGAILVVVGGLLYLRRR